MVTFFAQAKKVTRSSAGGAEALHLKPLKKQSKTKMVSRLTSSAVESRGNDERKNERVPERRRSLPACAGMTSEAARRCAPASAPWQIARMASGNTERERRNAINRR